MKVLVTGGAGYIGSHTVRDLTTRGHEVVVFDSLERGHASSVQCQVVRGDLRDAGAVRAAIDEGRYDAVIHFAAFCAAGESVAKPDLYFANNVTGTINLLNTMVRAGVKLLVFSSSCSVYGQPSSLPVTEAAPTRPENPYGESKLLVERMLPWYAGGHGLRSVSLRYFNAAGGSLDGVIGDDSRPASRLIPLAMKTALGQRAEFVVLGTDYPTADGTCIRDYVHVLDLADAHVRSLEYLESGGKTDFFNVGVGAGYSVLQVVDMVKRVSGIDFAVRNGARRPGDPAEVYADTCKIRGAMGWQARYGDLETIIRSDWAWHSAHPTGYPD
jgi:UDP-glucose 4-epimerase